MAEGSQPMLAMLRAMVAGEVSPPPVARMVGFALVEVEEGRAVFQMQTDPERHANPMGTVHGGILCDLGDAAMGCAMASTLREGESFTTLELKANYFKPVWKTRLTARAQMVKRSRSLGYLECDVLDAEGALVARLGSTCMVLQGEAAKGR